MAAATIQSVVHGWNGSRKRNRVVLTLADTNTDTISPYAVGLKEIEAVVPTSLIGTVDGVTSVVAGICTSYQQSDDTVIGTAGKHCWDFFGQ